MADIRLIALDLDGTTLTRRGLTKRTKQTLEEAIRRGVHVVVATGRTYTALPPKIFTIKGLEYIITSNGAQITSLKENRVIYTNNIDEEPLKEVKKILEEANYPIEVFTDGRAYVDRTLYEDVKANGSTFMDASYIIRTRNPVDGIFDMMEKHSKTIENINIHFEFFEDKEKMRKRLSDISDITITSSMPHNIEIGGSTTSKATALAALGKILNLELCHVMACGDSPNDIAMIEEAGLGVAMGNGEASVKAAADFIAPSNNGEGVAYAVEKFVLGRKMGAFAKIQSFKSIVLSTVYGKAVRIYKKLQGKKNQGNR